MKIFKSYSSGWAAALNSKRMTSLIYLIYLVLALLLVIPFYKLFSSAAGNSMMPGQLIKGFDATALVELLRDSGQMFSFYLKAFWPWLIVFLILGTFFQGGVISWISNTRGRFSSGTFFRNCVYYFWPFIKTAFYSIIIQAVLALIVYLPVVLLVGRDNLTDKYIVTTVIAGIAIHLVLLIWGTMIAEYTRLILFRTSGRKVLKALWKAFKICVGKIAALFAMYLLWLIIPLALFIGFYLLRTKLVIDTGMTIFLLFLVQQVFIWLRFLLKIQKTSIFYSYLVSKARND